MVTRKDFLRLSAAAMAGMLLGENRAGVQAQASIPNSSTHYSGANLSDWEMTLGDGVYAAPGEAPVSIEDIETVHFPEYSELRANIYKRRIMAHNITFKKFFGEHVFNFVHTFGYKFRLPYLPSVDNPDINPQTIEGGIGLWDGQVTHLAYESCFQWYINPWGPDVNSLRTWTDADNGTWEIVGTIPVDMEWHSVRITLDYRREATALVIDDQHYLCRFARIQKDDFGPDVSASISAEIINLYPGETHPGALHIAEFKDWYWDWEPYNICSVYLPMLSK